MGFPNSVSQALRTVFPYTVFGSLWIWGSDSLVLWFTQDPLLLSKISMGKGWGFVLITSILLFLLVYRKLKTQEKLHFQLETRRVDLEEFLYVASHHLKTPLVTIHGFSSELKDEIREPVLNRKAIEDISNRFLVASGQMEEILRNITHLHRSLRNNPSPKVVNLHTLINKQWKEVKSLSAQFQGEAQIDPIPNCFADEDNCTVIVQEILTNYCRHCKDQTNSRLTIFLLKKSFSQISICFEDNGPGFTVPVNNSLFHPALRKPTEQDSAGLRIGLGIAWRCAKWNGGDLEITSTKGKGTRVILTLPKA